jgi:hypothetical protein
MLRVQLAEAEAERQAHEHALVRAQHQLDQLKARAEQLTAGAWPRLPPRASLRDLRAWLAPTSAGTGDGTAIQAKDLEAQALAAAAVAEKEALQQHLQQEHRFALPPSPALLLACLVLG